MNHVESQLALPEDRLKEPPSLGQLIALVDALHRGTLNPTQLEITRILREGLNQFAENRGRDLDVCISLKY